MLLDREVEATLLNNNGGGGNGGGKPNTTAEVEGVIDSITAIADELEVTVDKEGNIVTLVADNRTTVFINGQPADLPDLQVGDKAKVTYDTSTNHASEFMIEGGGGNGGENGGGGNGGQLSFEGFINSITTIADALEVTVDKEGTIVTVIVDSQTNITVNEQSAGLNDLQVGDKATGKYDSSTNHASEFIVEGG